MKLTVHAFIIGTRPSHFRDMFANVRTPEGSCVTTYKCVVRSGIGRCGIGPKTTGRMPV